MKLIKTTVASLSLLATPVSAFAQTTLTNPTKIESLPELFQLIFSFLIAIVGGLAIIFLIIGGIRYILARGDEKSTKSAKDQITAALIGLVIALLAVALVVIVGNILGTGGLNVVNPPVAR
ncbi:MAG TPA: pilin [Patescibacteria group bacterium]|nr:pilin [Patescibacteria group bacterium]